MRAFSRSLPVTGGRGLWSEAGNIISAHQVSTSHAYGRITMAYNSTATGNNTPVIQNGSGAIAVHTSGLIQSSPSTTGTVIGCGQFGGGTRPTSLEAEMMGLPAETLVTGAHMQIPATATVSGRIVRVTPEVQANGSPLPITSPARSNRCWVMVISALFDMQAPASALPQWVYTGFLDGNSISDITLIYPTFRDASGGNSRHRHSERHQPDGYHQHQNPGSHLRVHRQRRGCEYRPDGPIR